MSPAWQILDAPFEPEEPPLMDAVLTPNRSLSRQAFMLVMGSFALMNIGVAIVFWLHGAYPVSGFMGLDVLALGWAFHISYRSGRAVERVTVSREAIVVMRKPPGKPETYWGVSPLWARVEDDPRSVRISAGGRDVLVGGFLSLAERRSFAAALNQALTRARR